MLGNYAIFVVTDDIFVACCVIKIENNLKYNLCRSIHLFQGKNVTRISTKWFLNF